MSSFFNPNSFFTTEIAGVLYLILFRLLNSCNGWINLNEAATNSPNDE